MGFRNLLVWNVLAAVSMCICGAQEWDWVQRFQGSGGSGNSVAFDVHGNVFVAGGLSGTNQVGTNQFISAGGSDVFIAKLSPAGEVLWAIQTGGLDDDWARLVVTSNGVVFVSGHFTIRQPLFGNALTNDSDITNVFVARVDDGRFSWFDTTPPGTDAGHGGIALGPDESIWTVGNSNRLFVRHYDQAGQLLGGFTMSASVCYPNAIAVSQEHIFVTALFCSAVDLGTTNLTDWGCAYFTAGADQAGHVQWAWSAGRYWDAEPITGIATTTDGGVISVGYWNTGLPQGYGFVVRHSADGALLWRVDRTGYFKNSNYALGVAVDDANYVHVVGNADRSWPGGYDRWPVWAFALDPEGHVVSEQFIASTTSSDRNVGLAVAVARDGTTAITGQLMGIPLFGTNRMGTGSSDLNPFVALRATVVPVLQSRGSGTNFALKWPRTALPFALQQTDDLLLSAWSDVTVPPAVTGLGSETILGAGISNQFFRLRLTNEAYACHAPITYPLYVSPSPTFLGRSSVFLTCSNSSLAPTYTGWGFDPYYAALGFEWFNADTGQALTNGTSVHEPAPRRDTSGTYLVANLTDASLTFPIGTNTIMLVTSDADCHSTNTIAIEVLSVTTAIDQMIAAVQAATTPAQGTRLTTPLQAARDAAVNRDFAAAQQQMQDFQSRLQADTELSDAQKSLFNSAAASVLSAIQGCS